MSQDEEAFKILGNNTFCEGVERAIMHCYAVRELAKAMNYIQDVCTPVHIWGYAFNNSWLGFHQYLEEIWNAIIISDGVEGYMPVGKRFTCTFANVEELGIRMGKAALSRYRDWINEKKLSAKDKVKNTMSVPIAVKLWLSDHSPNLSEIGFKDGWGKVFELPYLVSYEAYTHVG